MRTVFSPSADQLRPQVIAEAVERAIPPADPWLWEAAAGAALDGVEAVAKARNDAAVLRVLGPAGSDARRQLVKVVEQQARRLHEQLRREVAQEEAVQNFGRAMIEGDCTLYRMAALERATWTPPPPA